MHPAVPALREMARALLGQYLAEMFDKADDILFDSVQQARDGTEQRLYLDSMRTVRVQRARIVPAFQAALDAALSRIDDDPPAAGAASPEDVSMWSLEDGDVLEERLAVSSLETRAGALCAPQYAPLRGQLARLAGLARGQISEESMSPSRIVGAFRDSMTDLTVEVPVKLVVYKLFERLVVCRFPELYMRAGRLLAEHGVEPERSAAANGGFAPAASRVGVATPAAPHATGVPAWVSGLAPETVGAFGAYASAAAAAAPPQWAEAVGTAVRPPAGYPGVGMSADPYGDAVLAQEISQILTSYGEGRQPQSPQWIPPEAVALVARMFDQYYQDPRLPEQFKPILGKLQMPVMKAALSDRSFFSNPQHPARRIIGDLFEMLIQGAAASGAAPTAMLDDLDGLADAVAGAYRLELPELQSMRPGPFDEETASGFLRQQEELRQRKADARIERARRIVAHELERRIAGRSLDAGARRLLLSGFGPLLGADYLRYGIDSLEWSASCALVDRVLHSLRPRHHRDDGRADDESSIVDAVTQGLQRVGMPGPRADALVAGLREAYLRLDEHGEGADDRAAERHPVPAQRALPVHEELDGLLSILLVPGTWYTIYDPALQSKHWVRVKGFYRAQSTVLFEHYMEPRFMQLRSGAFATIVCDGHATPIDPSSDLQRAIARIRELPFERATDPIAWIEPAEAPATAH